MLAAGKAALAEELHVPFREAIAGKEALALGNCHFLKRLEVSYTGKAALAMGIALYVIS